MNATQQIARRFAQCHRRVACSILPLLTLAMVLSGGRAQAQLISYSVLKEFPNTNGLGLREQSAVIEGSDGLLFGVTAGGGLDNNGVVFRIAKNGTGYQVLHQFSPSTFDGASPRAELIEGSDGVLYGTTRSGGQSGAGTVFKMNKDGTGYSIVRSFGGTVTDGKTLLGAVTEGSDGLLYGTTEGGGTFNLGTVFRMNKNGSAYAILYNFAGTADGKWPQAGVVEASDGVLYGTTASGGVTDRGSVYKINKDGTGYSTILTFAAVTAHPSRPMAAVIEGADGALYGTSQNGGTPGNGGTVFRVLKDGTGLSVLKTFASAEGLQPLGKVVQLPDGMLYGTTSIAGPFFGNAGSVFKLSTTGAGFTVLHALNNSLLEGALIYSHVARGSDGRIYCGTDTGGSAVNGTLFGMNTDGTGFSVLHQFNNTGLTGRRPPFGVIEGSDGKLYGTCESGGLYDDGSQLVGGTLFSMNKDGTGFTVLRQFNFTLPNEGRRPMGVIEGSDGALYGVTVEGGAFASGIIYKINKDGSGYTLLRTLNPVGGDAALPRCVLVEGSDGALYGTGAAGVGRLFRINKDGSGYATLRSMASVDGSSLQNGLIEGSDGALYGTASAGGTTGLGTIFKIQKNGSGFTLLRTFAGGAGDGATPRSILLEGSDGILYGTTVGGGTTGRGTVYKINKDGTGFAIVRQFPSSSDSGAFLGGLIEAPDGVLYGTAAEGGVFGSPGTVFKVRKDGSGYAIIRPFAGVPAGDGSDPQAELFFGSDGAFYGITPAGGNKLSMGTVYRFTAVLAPSIVTHPASLTVTQGSSASFAVVASGTATLTYQWRLGGVAIPSANGSSYIIPSASPAQAGSYDVVVANTAGSITSLVATLVVRQQDYGDAPDSYLTLRPSDGPRHLLVPGIWLGAAVDGEVDGTPNSTATGDDANATDDEDGVSFTSPLRPGSVGSMDVVASAAGKLDAWIDYDANGSFSGAGEAILVSVNLVAGVNNLFFPVPPVATPAATFARFRFSSAGGLSPSGAAADGEVEDYAVVIEPVADLSIAVADGPDPAPAGGALTYTVTVHNHGLHSATAVSVIDTLPVGVALQSVSSSQGSCTPSGGAVNCNLGSMAAEGSATITISVTSTVCPPATLINSATVSAATFDPDLANNSATVSTTAVDLTPPTATCPANLSVPADAGQCSAVVSFAATVSDNCPGAGLVCAPPSGHAFPVGSTTVTCTATDASGNPATCSFSVTVNDTQPPTASCPVNVSVPADAGQCSAVVSFAATVSDNCPGAGLVCAPPSGHAFPVGSTLVTCTATDASGNPATCSFSVTVNDTQPPTASCPVNVSVPADAGQCSAVVSFAATVSDNCPGAGLVCAPPSGHAFPVGSTLVTCTATDASGNPATCSFSVAVNDTQPPTASCPANVSVAADAGQCSAVVSFAATVSDNCPGAGLVCAPPSGHAFPVGSTTVTCTATDASGNPATCSFSVAVNDTQPPTASCPANVSVPADAGQCSAVVSFAATVSDNCPGAGLACAPPSGHAFPVGSTTVTCTATDASGNPATCSFSVTVNDTQPPTASCPANVSVPADAGQCSAVVSFAATVSDNCPGAGLVCAPPSGHAFPVGSTTVTCTATDASGNPATCSFSVTVNDTQPPTASCPANVSIPADAGQCSAVVSFAATVSDNCPGAGVACAPPSGHAFPVGSTTVTCTATDASGNPATCSFSVAVNDTQPPTASCPANVSVPADAGQCSAVVSFAATVSDNCPGAGLACAPPSGHAFPVGSTTVTCTATDASGNPATCSFSVTVNDTQPPTASCPANVAVTIPAGQSTAAGVSLGAPVMSDNCSALLASNDAPSSFPLGTTTVTWTVADAAANTVTCQQQVTVSTSGGAGLEIACPPAVIVPADAGQCHTLQAHVNLGVPTVTGSAVSVTSNAPASFPLGSTLVTWTAMDAGGSSVSCEQSVTVIDTQAPVFGPVPIAGPFILNSGPQIVGPIVVTDNCALDPLLTFASVSIGTATVGLRPVTFTAVDMSGNTAAVNALYRVQYAATGTFNGAPGRQVLEPVNANGSSVFQQNRTVAIKFRVLDALGHSIGTPGLVTNFKLYQTISGTVVSTVNEDPVSSTPDIEFRWDAVAQQWTFNLSTKSLAANKTYVYRISLNDGTYIEFQFGLR